MKHINVLFFLTASLSVASAATVPVSIIDFTYVPDTASVTLGDSVVWTNNGTHTHTSTSGADGVPNGLWNSGFLNPGAMYGHKFADTGSFPYYCAVHYPINGMSGLIRVRSGGIEETPVSPAPTVWELAAEPSPFRAAVRISYDLSTTDARDPVSLRVYRVSGAVVRELADGQSAPGRQTVAWDGLDNRHQTLPAGVYLVRLQVGTRTLTRELLKLQ